MGKMAYILTPEGFVYETTSPELHAGERISAAQAKALMAQAETIAKLRAENEKLREIFGENMEENSALRAENETLRQLMRAFAARLNATQNANAETIGIMRSAVDSMALDTILETVKEETQ